MSKEEILNRINDLIHTCDVGIKEHGEYDDLFEVDKQALIGLLDLYNEEKEKNKQLENADLTTIYIDGFYDGKNKLKDKIKERIEEVENEIKEKRSIAIKPTDRVEGRILNDQIDALYKTIEVLKELLEE